jgi:hypothetical protein
MEMADRCHSPRAGRPIASTQGPLGPGAACWVEQVSWAPAWALPVSALVEASLAPSLEVPPIVHTSPNQMMTLPPLGRMGTPVKVVLSLAAVVVVVAEAAAVVAVAAAAVVVVVAATNQATVIVAEAAAVVAAAVVVEVVVAAATNQATGSVAVEAEVPVAVAVVAVTSRAKYPLVAVAVVAVAIRRAIGYPLVVAVVAAEAIHRATGYPLFAAAVVAVAIRRAIGHGYPYFVVAESADFAATSRASVKQQSVVGSGWWQCLGRGIEVPLR